MTRRVPLYLLDVDLHGLMGREQMWRLESWITGALGAFVAQVLIRTVYRLLRRDDKPASAIRGGAHRDRQQADHPCPVRGDL